jgi:hypothetical protein
LSAVISAACHTDEGRRLRQALMTSNYARQFGYA